MKIININGPINAGKTTVARIMCERFGNALQINCDFLVPPVERAELGLTFYPWIAETLKRLDAKISELKQSREFDAIVFDYPIDDESFARWSKYADEDTKFFCITVAPDMAECIKNRGVRELTEGEVKRIKEMYTESYHNRPYADLIVNNTNQSPDETVDIIMNFLNAAG